MRPTLFTLAALALVVIPAATQERPVTAKTSPVLVREVKPQYTDAAKVRKIQGTVELVVLVQADGTVGPDVRITKSLDPDLDQEAIKAARQWRFNPGTKDGEPVAVEVNLEMTFTLRDGPVYRVGNGVTAPQPTKHVNPRYTGAARQAGLQGRVELTGIVETDGTIRSIRVTTGLDPELDQQAIEALSQWTFKPGQKDGADVRVRVDIEMTFTLR